LQLSAKKIPDHRH